ncbi:MAG: hypothetical protein JW727_03500 [Candidatus Aenigmarchaeota archaeon]|nr:hypothetical protein [Candidatus Aenigmarchaeota archaeon]
MGLSGEKIWLALFIFLVVLCAPVFRQDPGQTASEAGIKPLPERSESKSTILSGCTETQACIENEECLGSCRLCRVRLCPQEDGSQTFEILSCSCRKA